MHHPAYRAVKKKAVNDDVIHYVIRETSVYSYCSVVQRVDQVAGETSLHAIDYHVVVGAYPEPYGAIVTCIACLAEAEEVV